MMSVISGNFLSEHFLKFQCCVIREYKGCLLAPGGLVAKLAASRLMDAVTNAL